MATTPNYNFPVWDTNDITAKFIDFREQIAGTGKNSSFMRIDAIMKDFNTRLQGVEIGSSLTYVDAQGTDIYTAEVASMTAYADDFTILVEFQNTNTSGNCSLEIFTNPQTGLGAKGLYAVNPADGQPIAFQPGDLKPGIFYIFVYHNGQWLLVGIKDINDMTWGKTGDQKKILAVNNNSNGVLASDYTLDDLLVKTTILPVEKGAGTLPIGTLIVNPGSLTSEWQNVSTAGLNLTMNSKFAIINSAIINSDTNYNYYRCIVNGTALIVNNNQTPKAKMPLFLTGTTSLNSEYLVSDGVLTYQPKNCKAIKVGTVYTATSAQGTLVLAQDCQLYTFDASGGISEINGVPLAGGQVKEQYMSGADCLVEHKFGKQYPRVSVIRLSDQSLVDAQVIYTNTNSLRVLFASAPAANAYLIRVEA